MMFTGIFKSYTWKKSVTAATPLILGLSPVYMYAYMYELVVFLITMLKFLIKKSKETKISLIYYLAI